jgi:hypothetical protein
MSGAGRDYYQRKRDAGKTHLEAMRCLKRRLSNVVFQHLIGDHQAKVREGQMGATLTASATDPIPMASTSDKPLPGLTPDLTPAFAGAS